MATAFALDHIVLVVTDVERSLAWYMKHAGLASVNVDEWRPDRPSSRRCA